MSKKGGETPDRASPLEIAWPGNPRSGSADRSGNQLINRTEGRIGHRHRTSADIEGLLRVQSETGEVGVEQVPPVDLALRDFGALLVGRSDDRTRRDALSAQGDRPGGAQ